ncbi:hypothetical protein [Luteolibacter sp. AS25]|uniref:hypothetical protein n=1 Tax=Luteolibacter sp. AS25 TaxID=3135776 RepID=UPI00398A71A1
MKKFIRKSHRWLGLLFSLTILMSSGSGVIHVIMSRTQAAPPSAKPSEAGLNTAAITISPAQAFPDTQPTAINIRNIAGTPHYQAFLPDQTGFTYIDATTGTENKTADTTYAREIASKFLASDEVEQTDFLTSFNREYIGIFRILPVYRFDLADGKGTRVYVSTITGSVTRHTDDKKQFEADIFSLFHKFMFIPNKDLRDLTISAVTGGAFLISILGIVLFFLTRPRKK